jgi:hypothetical protein
MAKAGDGPSTIAAQHPNHRSPRRASYACTGDQLDQKLLTRRVVIYAPTTHERFPEKCHSLNTPAITFTPASITAQLAPA